MTDKKFVEYLLTTSRPINQLQLTIINGQKFHREGTEVTCGNDIGISICDNNNVTIITDALDIAQKNNSRLGIMNVEVELALYTA